MKSTKWINIVILLLVSFLVVVSMFLAFRLPASLKQKLLLKVLPNPTILTYPISDNDVFYILSVKIDYEDLVEQATRGREPKERYVMSSLHNSTLNHDRNIPKFVTASATHGRIVLFDQGGYNVFDGNTWSGVKTSAIGIYPKGIATPSGLFVLSSINNELHLMNIQTNATAEIPLPKTFKESMPEPVFQMIDLFYYENQVCLLCSTEAACWNGSSWGETMKFPFSGNYRLISNGKDLHALVQIDNNPDRTLFEYYFNEGKTWSRPRSVALEKPAKFWGFVLYQGNPTIYVLSSEGQQLYSLNQSKPPRLFKITNPIQFKYLYLIAIILVVYFVLRLIVVSLISRFIQIIIQKSDVIYKSGSLFQRCLAVTVDTVLLLIPTIYIMLYKMAQISFTDFPVIALSVVGKFAVVFLVIKFIYFSVLEGFYGVTLGKWILGLRVARTDMSSCGMKSSLLRNSARLIDGLLFGLVGAFVISNTDRSQRIGDLMAQTVVIESRGK